MDQLTRLTIASTNRRSLLFKGAAVGAGALSAAALGSSLALAATDGKNHPTKGDIAILRFLAALETLESDLWLQYNELGGIEMRVRNKWPPGPER